MHSYSFLFVLHFLPVSSSWTSLLEKYRKFKPKVERVVINRKSEAWEINAKREDMGCG
jgi:hypothetical protein